MKTIGIEHGDGGTYTSELIKNIFYKHFNNDLLLEGYDSALFNVEKGRMAFTTDSFIVKPLFFKGGDIGKLAVCGTINDLTACGATPLYLSTSFIIEEGFDIDSLEKIVMSMSETCKKAGVKIVTGDTKVVEKGKVDKVFINTSGVGIIEGYYPKEVKKNDKIIITGTIAEHGTAIACERYNLNVSGDLKSDCSPLNNLLNYLNKYNDYIKIMRDPTRGGVAQVLNELSLKSKLGIHIYEKNIPIKDEIQSINEILGLDPLYMACEGRMIIAADSSIAEELTQGIICSQGCKEASIIGHFTNEEKYVFVENVLGGKRIINPLDTHMLPRIC